MSACSSLLFFQRKNGISRAEPFPREKESHAVRRWIRKICDRLREAYSVLGGLQRDRRYCRCELPGVCAVSDLARCGRTDGRPDL
ncbi:hypothetical protein GAY75_16905 [Phocaeicola vulgatus]|nr:hypothetical protein GAY75_16905 [Phocaeicola vulgatus]